MLKKSRRHPRPLVRIGVSALLLSLVVSMYPIMGFANDVQAGGGNPADQTHTSRTPHPSSPMWITANGTVTR